jgi:hypothetical protein
VSAPASSVGHAVARPWSILNSGVVARRLRLGAVGVAVGLATAGAVSYAPVPRLVLIAVPAAVGLAFLVFTSRALAAVLLGVSLPEIQDVTGGHLGLHVAASDVMLVLVTAGLLAEAVASGRRLGVLGALRPVRFAFVQYAWLIVILLALHPGLGSAVKSVQRLELFVLPLLVGAYIALRRDHMLVLRAYVLSTTVLAVIWPALNSAGIAGQLGKNALGQLLACAILLLVAVPGLRRMLPCLPVLIVGLALTVSRGSVLGVVVGVAVLSFIVGGRSRRMLIARTVMIVATGLVIYQWLPSDIAARLTSFSGAAGTAGAYNIDVRFTYAHDAERLIAAHPWTGVGVGNYLAGDPANLTQTTDPHDVILLEAAEGGYVFAASFALLIAAAVLGLWRMREAELAPAAMAILLATVAHGLVDVFWVRGLPVLGFLLVGMTCGLAAQRQRQGTV